MKRADFGTLWFVFLDHDKREGCVKGPMTPESLAPWHATVEEMKAEGRNVDSYTQPGSKTEADIIAGLNGTFHYPTTAFLQRKANSS